MTAEGSPEAVAFVRERADRILHGGVSQVVKGLRSIVTKRGLRGENAKTLTEVVDYLYANPPACATTCTCGEVGRPPRAPWRERASAW